MRTPLIATLFACLGGCGSDPPFVWELLATAPGSDHLELRIDGAFLAPSTESPAELVWRYEREYRDWAHADGTVRLDVLNAGELRRTFDISERICSAHAHAHDQECGPMAHSRIHVCLDAEGQGVGLCGSLTCSDASGPCGGYISSQ